MPSELKIFVNEAYDAISNGALIALCGYGAGSLLGRSAVPIYEGAKAMTGLSCATYALSSPEDKDKRAIILIALAIGGIALGIFSFHFAPVLGITTAVFYLSAHYVFTRFTGTTPRNIFSDLSGGYILTTKQYKTLQNCAQISN